MSGSRRAAATGRRAHETRQGDARDSLTDALIGHHPRHLVRERADRSLVRVLNLAALVRDQITDLANEITHTAHIRKELTQSAYAPNIDSVNKKLTGGS